MTQTGTAIERSSTGDVEVVRRAPQDAKLVPSDRAVLARENHARRVEVAGKVLSLLTSVGNLALRILEQRAADEDVAAVPRSVTDAGRVNRPRAEAATRRPESGARGHGGRRRHRQRGGW